MFHIVPSPQSEPTPNKTIESHREGGMLVSTDFPPNHKQLIDKFGDIPCNVVFTYGNTIYNPGKGNIDKFLYYHEKVHFYQQGENPEEWWGRYLIDPQFRLNQELEAYRAQYKYYCEEVKDRNWRVKYLYGLAKNLCGSSYGNIITHSEAMRAIK